MHGILVWCEVLLQKGIVDLLKSLRCRDADERKVAVGCRLRDFDAVFGRSFLCSLHANVFGVIMYHMLSLHRLVPLYRQLHRHAS